MRAAPMRAHYLIQKIVLVLPSLAIHDAIHAFIFSLKLYLNRFIKAQVKVVAVASFNEVMTVALKLVENI